MPPESPEQPNAFPNLSAHQLDQMGRSRERIARAVRALLADHGETGSFKRVGTNRDDLEDWIRTYARQLMRQYATLYVTLAPADEVATPLLTRLLRRVDEEWLRGVEPGSGSGLRAHAEAAMREEFAVCCEETGLSAAASERPSSQDVSAAPPPKRRAATKRDLMTTQVAGKQPATTSSLNRDFLDARGAAEFLGVTLQWVRDHTTRVEPIVPHTRIGKRTIRFERPELLRFIEEQREDRPRWERTTPPLKPLK
jgi:hypothetical protein